MTTMTMKGHKQHKNIQQKPKKGKDRNREPMTPGKKGG